MLGSPAVLASLTETIVALHQAKIPHSTFSFILQEANSKKVLAEIRPNDYFYPASNTKLFTAAAALWSLGPEFQFQTTMHTVLSHPQPATLRHDVALVFRGDPSLTYNDLYQLLKTLHTHGIRTIQGNIIIDDTAFAAPDYAPGWTNDSIDWYFSAPISAIVLNENSLLLKISKAEKIGTPLSITPVTHTPGVFVKAHVVAATPLEAKQRCQFSLNVKNNKATLGGCWPSDQTPTTIALAVDNPRQIASNLVAHYLQQLSITLQGNIIFTKAPVMPVVAVKKSAPLQDLLHKVLAESNNLYTECLTKTLGLTYKGQGSFQAGTQAIVAILAKSNNAFSDLFIHDGSGQSRYNLISAKQIADLLDYCYHHDSFPVFYSTLSVNGKTGSLAKRLSAHPGKIIAKTGTANGTSALSGYLTDDTGKHYVFSLLINQSIYPSSTLKAFEDTLCQKTMPYLSQHAKTT